MPNHVYSIISVEEKYTDKLKEISKVGLCRYYKPMPLELEKSSSPTKIITVAQHKKGERGITKVMQRNLKEKYGFDNWYDWANHNWGTKWGCYDGEHDDDVYRYTTAWGPVNDDILSMLLKDIPSFHLSWEEEQGYGAEIDYVDGEVSSYLDWDTPPWVWNIPKNTNDDIVYLERDYTNGEGTFPKGFYAYCSLHEYLGDTLEEAEANLM